MKRRILEPETLQEVSGFVCSEPVRFIFANPYRGGPALHDVRALLAAKGVLRFSATPRCLFADLDPGEPEVPMLALAMIVRDDAVGLERALLSVLSAVDEIVISVDGRSTDNTVKVAEAYGDNVRQFHAADIGLTPEEWAAGHIHFANARNFGQVRVQAPWVLALDSDEFFAPQGSPLRDALRRAPADVGSFSLRVALGTSELRDTQRIARSTCRWQFASHNQLLHGMEINDAEGLIVHDTSLRPTAEMQRRDLQRDAGIDTLRKEAAEGQLIALYHVAKHDLGMGRIDDALKAILDYRSRTEVHGVLRDERTWLAFGAAAYYYMKDDYEQAEVWAIRALLDGPYTPAMCLLGDIAEETGDLQRALRWYDAACAITDVGDGAPRVAPYTQRQARRDDLRRALAEKRTLVTP